MNHSRHVLFVAAALLCSLEFGEARAQASVAAGPTYPLPAGVEAAIRSTPTSLGIAVDGTREVTERILKSTVLTMSKKSRLVFLLDPKVAMPPFLAVAAETVYIEGAQDPADLVEVTYRFTRTPDGDVGPDGASGYNQPNPTGARGGNGQPGLAGGDGSSSLNLQPIYLLFQQVKVSQGTPMQAGLLKLTMAGPDGGNGGSGGNGGRGGNGANGTSGSSGFLSCDAGPGRGGDSGTPGAGAIGGNGSAAGNGADIRLFGPQAAADVMGFFRVSNGGGTRPGVGAAGGACGGLGVAGGGGTKPSVCSSEGGNGNQSTCPHAPAARGTDSTTVGIVGGYSLTVRDLAGLF